MTEQYGYHAVNSLLILGCLLGCLLYLVCILVKMTINRIYIKRNTLRTLKNTYKKKVKNLMFKLHKLDKQC